MLIKVFLIFNLKEDSYKTIIPKKMQQNNNNYV